MREQPLIIASATRSGSTLLQRILNVHPGITIWGEHMGILTHVRRALVAAEGAEVALGRGYAQSPNLVGTLVDAEPFSPHINPFDLGMLRAMAREFVVRIFAESLPEGTRWGFKEVRYFGEDLEFIAKLFPAARFVVLARDPADQISSFVRAPWRRKPNLKQPDGVQQLRRTVATAASNWTKQYGSLKRFVDRHPERSMVLTYDDLSAPLTATNVFAHIGLEPPDEASVKNVIARRTGSSDRTTAWTGRDREVLDDVIASTSFPPHHRDVLSFYFVARDGARAGDVPTAPVP